jgi:hypothetical protein
VNKNWQDPKEYMLDKLANYKLVIYGEVHKRKASWDLLKSILKDPAFSKKTGTIFLEIGRDNQDKMDSFFSNRKMDKEILLSVFRNIQMQGWDDRGMYEFIIDLWKLNKKLPINNKVKVVLVDVSRPWSSLKTKEEFSNFIKNIPDRNQQMADIIEKKINSHLQFENLKSVKFSDNKEKAFVINETDEGLANFSIVQLGETPKTTEVKVPESLFSRELADGENTFSKIAENITIESLNENATRAILKWKNGENY